MLNELIELAKKDRLFNPNEISIRFTKTQAKENDWLSKYSEEISKIQVDTGAYIFSSSDEILYIGASGKITNKEYATNWKLPQRLKASRGKNHSGIDVSTPIFIQQLLTKGKTEAKSYGHINLNIDEFKITILENYKGVPASYLEAFLLFKYYSIKQKLPRLNLAF